MILKKISILYFLLLSLFTSLIILTFTIPTSAIKDNVVKSVKQIQEDGLWYKPMGFYLFQIDNMTDCLMLNISVYADCNRPIRAAMMAEHAQPYSNGDTRSYKNITNTTLNIATKEHKVSTESIDYARYWHGYQVILRPLLCVLDYNEIITLNYFAMSILLVAVTILMYRRLGRMYAFSFLATMIFSNIMIVPLAMQFSTCFYISMLCMLLFLIKPKLANNTEKKIMIFFMTGAITSYMDFLTTPLLTLGFPLIVVTTMDANRKYKLKNILVQSTAWIGGYASLWASKWIMAWVLTGENVFDSAMGSAMLRVGDTIVFGGEEMPMEVFFEKIMAKISTITEPLLLLFAIFSIISAAAMYFYKKRHAINGNTSLLVIAAMPLLWFAVMKNHSLQHIFFTWRDWMLTLWCLFILTYHTCKNNKP